MKQNKKLPTNIITLGCYPPPLASVILPYTAHVIGRECGEFRTYA